MMSKAKFLLCVALVIGPVGLAACSEASTAERQVDVAAEEPGGGEAAAQTAAEPKASAKPSAALTETDRMMLKQAENACRSGDFRSFLKAALRSKPVRARYFTAPIKTEQGTRSADTYNFPFQIMDTYYITSDSAKRAPNDWENVTLDINQASDNRVRVDWVRIDYGMGGNDPGADDDGAQQADDKEYGPRGYLIFKPTDKCWALLEDGIAG